jgi:hypothetical protein
MDPWRPMRPPNPTSPDAYRGSHLTQGLMAIAKAAALGSPLPSPADAAHFDALVALARVHRCLAIVAGPLQALPGVALPRIAELERAESGAWATYAVTAAAMGPVLEQAAMEGLTLIAYKGAAHAARYYQVPSARPMSDVDLLVLPEQKEHLYRIFRERNFSTFGTPGRDWTKDLSHERIFVPATAGSRSADVHTSPTSPARHRLPVGQLLARSRPGALFGAEVRFLSPEDELVVMAVNHAADHFRGGFVRFLDAWLVDRAERIDWSVVAQRARQAGAAAASWLTFSHAKRIAGLSVPDDILTALQPSALRRLWLNTVLDGDGFGEPHVALPRRIEQLLLTYPTLDQPTGFARFAAFHGGLRLMDAAQGLVDQLMSQRS